MILKVSMSIPNSAPFALKVLTIRFPLPSTNVDRIQASVSTIFFISFYELLFLELYNL